MFWIRARIERAQPPGPADESTEQLGNGLMTAKRNGFRASVAAAAAAMLLAGCGLPVEHDYLVPDPEYKDRMIPESQVNKNASVFGEGGLDLFDLGNRNKNAPGGGGGLAVNSYLWRASLDTIAFMPLASADPFGGVIITDWYTPAEAPDERYKMSVYILGRELRADGIKVAVFRQRSNGNGAWIASATAADTASSLENEILTRARQLRLTSTAKNN
jgi:hypothetical protein